MIEVASAPCISCISCSTLVAMFTTWFRRSLDVACLQVPHCDFNTSLSRSTDFCTEGFSLLPLLQGDTRDWHHAAFSQYQRGTRGEFQQARPLHDCIREHLHACLLIPLRARTSWQHHGVHYAHGYTAIHGVGHL